MRSELDFRTSNGDTNYPDTDSVLPVADGEAVNQTVLRRPTENARHRTELLRQFVQEHTLLLEMSPHLYQGYPYAMPCITFDGAYPTYGGTFSTTTDLVVAPFASSGGLGPYPHIQSTQATLSIGTPSSNEIVFTSVQKQYEGSSFPAADPNEIAVEIVAGSSLTVTLKGSSGNYNHIYATIISGTTTCAQLIAAITSAASTLVTVALGSGSSGSNAAPLWGPPQWAGDYTERFLKGGSAGVVHAISPTAFATFFAASLDNRIQMGDMIGIWYDSTVDKSGTGGRLQSTYENSNYSISAGQLFNSRREPWKLPNCIPICKCTADMTLLFADGATIQKDYPAALGSTDSFYLTNIWRGLVWPTGWGWTRLNTGRVNPPVTVKDAFDNVDYWSDAAMTEIIAARSSTIFGAKSSLDDRIEATDTHVRSFVSVTDGTLSTGGLYNGPTALRDAVVALCSTYGTPGATILVRKGNYTWSADTEIHTPVRIIAVEDGVHITYSSTGVMLRLGQDTSDSIICGVQITVTGFATALAVTDADVERLVLKDIVILGGTAGSNPLIGLYGRDHTLENIRLEPTDQGGIWVQAGCENVSITNYHYIGATTQVGLLIDGAKNTSVKNAVIHGVIGIGAYSGAVRGVKFENCYARNPSTVYADSVLVIGDWFSTQDIDGVTFENCEFFGENSKIGNSVLMITVKPPVTVSGSVFYGTDHSGIIFNSCRVIAEQGGCAISCMQGITRWNDLNILSESLIAGIPMIAISGGSHDFYKTEIRVDTSRGVGISSIIKAQEYTDLIRAHFHCVQVNTYSTWGVYATGDNPFYLDGTDILLEGLACLFTIPDLTTHGWELDVDEPLIYMHGANNGTVELRDPHITIASTALGGEAFFTLMGYTFYDNADGKQIVRGGIIDLTNHLNTNVLSTFRVIYYMQAKSVVDGLHVLCGTTGKINSIVQPEAPDCEIAHCRFDASSNDAVVSIVLCNSILTSATNSGLSIHNNTFWVNGASTVACDLRGGGLAIMYGGRVSDNKFQHLASGSPAAVAMSWCTGWTIIGNTFDAFGATPVTQSVCATMVPVSASMNTLNAIF